MNSGKKDNLARNSDDFIVRYGDVLQYADYFVENYIENFHQFKSYEELSQEGCFMPL